MERCAPVPVPDNAYSNTSLAVIDTIAQISCLPGFVFQDGTIMDIITLCGRDTKEWTQEPSGCVRKFKRLKKLFSCQHG